MTSRNEAILSQVKDDIQSMRTRGAGKIGSAAVEALAKAAQDHAETSLPKFRKQIIEAAKLLAAARPTAVTLRNALNQAISAIDGATSVEDAKRTLLRVSKEYPERVDRAKRTIADNALAYFRAGDRVLTHCHSTAAGGAIAHAANRLRGLRVISTETRPFRQGLIQAPLLAKQGVDVSLIVDSAVAHVMENEGVTRVVVGADTVAADGSVYNKIGTRQVAELAKRHRIPFYVCCERDKFSPYTLKGERVVIEERDPAEIARPDEVPGVRILNPVFDRTPPNLVTAIITDKGVLKPRQVRAFVEREFKGVRRWV